MYRPYLNNISPDCRILEIGPLTSPNLTKDRFKHVYYADIRSTEDIKSFYRAHTNIQQENIVDIDYVINKNGYADTMSNVEKFDYVVATHVIEHVPQLILWLQDLAKILKPAGKLCLTVPDKRYTFDHYRHSTSFAEIYDVYSRNIINHPARVLDQDINATLNDVVYWWKNFNNMDMIPNDTEQYTRALEFYQKARIDNYNMSGHYSVFTPESFLLILYGMNKLSLLPFKCAEFHSTEIFSNEFNCVLQNNPEYLNADKQISAEEDNKLLLLLAKHNDYYSSPYYKFNRKRLHYYITRFVTSIRRNGIWNTVKKLLKRRNIK